MNYFREMPDLTVAQFGTCPFCGKSITVEKEGELYSIECEECDTSLSPFVSLTHAYLVWNKRTAQPDAATVAVPADVAEAIDTLTGIAETWIGRFADADPGYDNDLSIVRAWLEAQALQHPDAATVAVPVEVRKAVEIAKRCTKSTLAFLRSQAIQVPVMSAEMARDIDILMEEERRIEAALAWVEAQAKGQRT